MRGSLLKGSGLKGSTAPEDEGENSTVEAQREHIGTLQKTLQKYEGLLTTFQARIGILETDKAHLESRLKLLPAPVEEVSSRLQELEHTLIEKEEVIKAEVEYRQQLSSSLHDRETKLFDLEAELNEAKKPWWKKMLRMK
jgi:chromosome segregation ATPase